MLYTPKSKPAFVTLITIEAICAPASDISCVTTVGTDFVNGVLNVTCVHPHAPDADAEVKVPLLTSGIDCKLTWLLVPSPAIMSPWAFKPYSSVQTSLLPMANPWEQLSPVTDKLSILLDTEPI